eukprot:COSAG01_NODE_2866_length_6949_cov_4.994599_7_plen_101_part_00
MLVLVKGLNANGSMASLVERLTEARLEDEADSDEEAEGEAEEGHDLWGVGRGLCGRTVGCLRICLGHACACPVTEDGTNAPEDEMDRNVGRSQPLIRFLS